MRTRNTITPYRKRLNGVFVESRSKKNAIEIFTVDMPTMTMMACTYRIFEKFMYFTGSMSMTNVCFPKPLSVSSLKHANVAVARIYSISTISPGDGNYLTYHCNHHNIVVNPEDLEHS